MKAKTALVNELEEKVNMSKTTASQRVEERDKMNTLQQENRTMQKKLNDEKNKREKIEFENKQMNETIKSLQNETSRLKNDLESYIQAQPQGDSLGKFIQKITIKNS